MAQLLTDEQDLPIRRCQEDLAHCGIVLAQHEPLRLLCR